MIPDRCIPIDAEREWSSALAGLPHSIVHTWEYCSAIQRSSGQPTFLYCHERQGSRVVCPIAERAYSGLPDVVTPYGIGGFTGATDRAGIDEDWRAFAARRGYVAGYLGLSPLFGGRLADSPDARLEKTLYVMNLNLSEAELFGRLSTNRQRQVRRFAGQSDELITDRGRVADFFVNEYSSFMQRKSAAPVYRLTRDSLRQLCDLGNVVLAGGGRGGRVQAAAMFGWTPFSGDYLFGLSLAGDQHYAAPLLWWGAMTLKRLGVPFLMLGGGIREGDALAEFKRRFGGLALPLKALRQVYRPGVYEELCRVANADVDARDGYFPAYHKPE